MNFRKWLNENFEDEIDLDNLEEVGIFGDALEEKGYPDIHQFRELLQKVIHMSGTEKSSSYYGVYWQKKLDLKKAVEKAKEWFDSH